MVLVKNVEAAYTDTKKIIPIISRIMLEKVNSKMRIYAEAAAMDDYNRIFADERHSIVSS
jgi:hypothetical protein